MGRLVTPLLVLSAVLALQAVPAPCPTTTPEIEECVELSECLIVAAPTPTPGTLA